MEEIGNYGAIIAVHGHKPPGFDLILGLKDVGLMLGASGAVKPPLPIASLLRDRYLSAIAKGRAHLDWSAIALGAADDAGTE